MLRSSPLSESGGRCVSLCDVTSDRDKESREAGGSKRTLKMVGFADLSNVDICQHLQHRSGVLFSGWCTWRAEMCVMGQKEPIHLVGFEDKRNQELNLIL